MFVEVEICLGTTCFVLGASALQELQLPEKLRRQTKISYVRCLNVCKNADKFSKAPYARIDGEIVAEISAEKLAQILEQKIKGEKNEAN
ncbi:thioredoxin [Candidatus Termititenax aidoneus]|uniref:Thioredoxin n=1 Tax=Termititenax aidoneus TaxID=2218524 RepID=A0A388TCQ5_TERA1|nr:thioredoxin [Candidatus Termititenax aidoneus]